MLTLRKELKVGFGIGAAVLGVAAVYGAMSLLTTRGDGQQANASGTSHVTDGGPAANTAGPDVVVGLPPEMTNETPATPTQVATGGNPSDPFSESTRTDGIAADPWTAALTTGRVPGGRNPANTNNAAGNNAGNAGDLIVTHTPETAKPAESAKPTVLHAPVETPRSAEPGRAPELAKPAVAGAAGGQKYTIAAGDTFSSIAAKQYGDRNLYQSIVKANPDINPSRLKIGTEIILPAIDTVKNERGSLAAPARAEAGTIDTTRFYRVQTGDTLHTISKRLYQRTAYWMAIYDLNKTAIGPDAGKLKVGAVLTLPQRPTTTR